MADKFNIKITVETSYLPEQSAPEEDQFVFVYYITMENLGQEALKLLNRHWIITDGNQKVLEVDGAGVVGQQPRISPGERYEYSSGTLIETPIGTMEGSYEMISDEGESYEAIIPRFHLKAPLMVH